jgi:DNA-formamidopyrimidine glycosylase|tara:strand:- start:2787 stop:3593 length:807 start_codon:yes stop_codon:yes gene_type:complete
MVPEGPEVKRISESLAERLSGRTLTNIVVLSGRYLKNNLENLSIVKDELPIEIVGAGCKGKFIFVILRDEWSIWCSLGMSGKWSEERTKHSRVKFSLNDGDVYFNDTRNFGTLKFQKNAKNLKNKLLSLGPDMLSEDISDDEFIKRIRKCKNKTICQAVMDQKVISGIGNYLKAECLYQARVSPYAKCSEISDERLSNLNSVIKSIIRLSYETGGATIKNYTSFDNKIGKYSQRFAVYNQKYDPEGKKVLKEKTPDGRTTHWVPEIQE